MSFSTKILVGLVSGVLVGVFFGEHAAVLKVAADGFVKLLQMAVLPYITISIITSLGTLRYDQAKTLGLRAGAVLGGLWCIALLFAFLIPVAFPEIETASFFSTTLVERRPPFNFIDIFIPSNPFNSLANNVVPAVVLFSVFLGIALIGVERKEMLLDVLTRRQRSPIERYKVHRYPDALRHLCHRRQHSGNVKPRAAGADSSVFDYLRAHGVARLPMGIARTGRGSHPISLSGRARADARCSDHRVHGGRSVHRAADPYPVVQRVAAAAPAQR